MRSTENRPVITTTSPFTSSGSDQVAQRQGVSIHCCSTPWRGEMRSFS